MLPDRVSNPGPLTYESGALPIALRGPAVHQGAKVEQFNVSNVIYHKCSHGAVSYTLNGENVNVMLEIHDCSFCYLTLLISQSNFLGTENIH